MDKQARKILIAEDTPTQAAYVKSILEKENYEICLAKDGREALDLVSKIQPDLIISDIMMPKMNGYELCRSLKSDPNFKHIPLILLTSLADVEDVIKGLECGADNFLTKPFDKEYFLTRVKYALTVMNLKKEDLEDNLVALNFYGRNYEIKSSKLQILNLLLSTFEAAVQRNHELNAAKTELQLSNSLLSESNIKLKVINDDLEKFTYSVSHDLRGPLRSITGFLNIFMEDYATGLDAKAKECLDRVSTAGKRMDQLIHGLLNLSKMGRREPQREEVNLSQMVAQILDDLTRLEPERRVSVKVERDVVVRGDSFLLRAAIENLLRNAWKFTSKRDETEIEFARRKQNDGSFVYYIKDNGVGFDMQLVGKLFEAFQRLHSEDEFEGTGIGLATVYRIVEMHGGKIWAEAETDRGATFFFQI